MLSLKTTKQISSSVGLLVLSVVMIVVTVSAQTEHRSKPTEVFVLATLHQFHADSGYYSFNKLSQIIREIGPDVICVELTAADIKSRRKQGTKIEYEKAVFPLADKYGYKLIPLEPDEPKFSTLVALNIESEKNLRIRNPDKAEAFTIYTDALYQHLFSVWTSPFDVNSASTDSHFEVKHEFQNAVYGDKQLAVWESWNGHFLDQVVKSARGSKKVLVLVGVEHAYWLRKALRKENTIRLREPATFLK